MTLLLKKALEEEKQMTIHLHNNCFGVRTNDF